MIGRRVASYTPRFWTLCALSATLGQSCYEQGFATAGGFLHSLRKMCRSISDKVQESAGLRKS
ncbi:MAG: hypothetical protein BECKG1743D_GA0114223_100152 [Candidatus Kentron sp. G]|nr:MAG: hypothetical protein BECKG1743D_GA0114223_100152 [Candidatus Kentron sp. G]